MPNRATPITPAASADSRVLISSTRVSRTTPSANTNAAAAAGSGATKPLVQYTTATSSPDTTAV